MGLLTARWLILAGSLAASAAVIDGFDIHGGLADLLVLSIVIGSLGALLRWAVWFVTLPIGVVASFGYLTDTLLVLLVAHFSATLHVANVPSALAATIVVSAVFAGMTWIVYGSSAGPLEPFTVKDR